MLLVRTVSVSCNGFILNDPMLNYLDSKFKCREGEGNTFSQNTRTDLEKEISKFCLLVYTIFTLIYQKYFNYLKTNEL